MISIEPLVAQHRGEVATFLTVITQEETFGFEVIEADRLLAAKAMRSVEHHVEGFVEQLPTVQTVPCFANSGSHPKLGIVRFQILDDLRAGATQDLQLDVVETFSQLVDVGKNEPELDAARYRELEGANLTIVDHGGERTRALSAVVALLKQRKHSLAKWRKHGARPLAPEKIAAKLPFQQLDGARQRRLRDVTFFRRTGEVQRPRNGQKVSNLVHFHANVPLDDHQSRIL